ncbi:MAG: LuxR family transcriptional regulator [Bacteroidetes bacterium]|nr:MAG: LuxR family transcriptional regulator [Bacteroidota bacterium]
MTGSEYDLLMAQRLNQASDAFVHLKELSEKITRQNRELQKKQELLDLVMNHVPAVIFMIDTTRNRITWVNQRLKQLLGFTTDQAMNGGTKFLRELIGRDDFHHIQQAVEYFNSRKGNEYKTLLHMHDSYNEEHIMSATVAPLQREEKGKVSSVICIALDVTRQTETQQELKQMLRAMVSNGSDKVIRSITRREYDVLRLIAREYSTKQIAEELNISIPTVETHRRNLLRKVEVKNTAGLVRFAVENMIV